MEQNATAIYIQVEKSMKHIYTTTDDNVILVLLFDISFLLLFLLMIILLLYISYATWNAQKEELNPYYIRVEVKLMHYTR